VRKSIEFELEDLNSRPDPEPLLVEMLHEAAFRDGPLGNPKLCPPETLNDIKKEDLYSFMKTLYLPKRTVLIL
jgi:processing peptidase subunit alpha